MGFDINQEDFGALCVCALRYCQGRQTYMPGLIREIVEKHLSELPDRDIVVMKNDCDSQRRFNLYGEEKIDKPGWKKKKKILEAEMKRRGFRV